MGFANRRKEGSSTAIINNHQNGKFKGNSTKLDDYASGSAVIYQNNNIKKKTEGGDSELERLISEKLN
jgi:hypothetical protein